MSKDCEDFLEALLGIVGNVVAVAVLAMAAVMLFGGCSRKTVYVPVEQTASRTDTLYKAIWRTDSVVDRDTVRITEDGTEIVRWRIRAKEVHDTVYESAVDSVRIVVPVPVERELSARERMRLGTWPWLVGAVVALAAWTGRKWIVRLLGLLRK